jgi:hypothetical protein
MSDIILQEPEFSKETMDVLRFLVEDNAFEQEFLLTAISEYCVRNSEECTKHLQKG